MTIDQAQLQHFATSGLTSHLQTVLHGAWVHKTTGSLITVMWGDNTADVVVSLVDGEMKLSTKGTDAKALCDWIQLAGLDCDVA